MPSSALEALPDSLHRIIASMLPDGFVKETWLLLTLVSRAMRDVHASTLTRISLEGGPKLRVDALARLMHRNPGLEQVAVKPHAIPALIDLLNQGHLRHGKHLCVQFAEVVMTRARIRSLVGAFQVPEALQSLEVLVLAPALTDSNLCPASMTTLSDIHTPDALPALVRLIQGGHLGQVRDLRVKMDFDGSTTFGRVRGSRACGCPGRSNPWSTCAFCRTIGNRACFHCSRPRWLLRTWPRPSAFWTSGGGSFRTRTRTL